MTRCEWYFLLDASEEMNNITMVMDGCGNNKLGK